MTALRALPVRVTPYPRETPDSYAIRLCRRNGLTWREFWHSIYRVDPKSANVTNGIFARIPEVLCRLGGIDAREHPQLTRHWTCRARCVERLELCARGHRGAGASSMCRRCSRGETVEVFEADNPVCVRHRRWYAGGLDVDIGAFPELLRAGRTLNGAMRLSGLTMSSPEARFLHGILYGWEDRGDKTARAEVSPVTQMADLPTFVKGMLLLASEDFLRLVEGKPTGLRLGAAHVRAFLRQERAAPARARLLGRLDKDLSLLPESGESDIEARLSEELDEDLYARWYGDVPGLQRLQILEELSKTELAFCRGSADPAGPLRSEAAVQRWRAVSRRAPTAYPAWYRW